MNVMVADDLKVIRMLVRKALAEHGVDAVDEAEDGAQALAMLDQKEYHLLILDWNMPHKTGLDVVHAVRGRGMECPIIMQTTNNMKHQVMEALRAGVNDYILKPYTTEYLIDKFEEHVFGAAMTAGE